MNKYIKQLNHIQLFLKDYPSDEDAQIALNAMLTSFHDDDNYRFYISNPVDKHHIAYTKNLIKDLKQNTKDPLAIYSYDYKGSTHKNLKILEHSKNIFSHYPDIKAPVTVKQVNYLINVAKTKVIPDIVKTNRENQIDNHALDKFKNALTVQIKHDNAIHQKTGLHVNHFNFGKNKYNLKNYIRQMLLTGRYDKKPHHISDALSTHTLEDNLGVEDGRTYRQDIKEENDDWFSENDPDSMKNKGYQKFIQKHQSHFNPDYVYPMADDIDDYPTPLTHRQLLKRCQESYL